MLREKNHTSETSQRVNYFTFYLTLAELLSNTITHMVSFRRFYYYEK